MKKNALVLILVLCLGLTNSGQPLNLLAQETQSQGIRVLNQDFEDSDLGNWEMKSWGGSASLEITTDEHDVNNHVLTISDREATDSDPLLNLSSYLKSGHTYDISIKMTLGNSSESFHLSSKVAAGGSEDYPWLVGNQEVSAGEWTTFSNTAFEVPADMTEVLIWFESGSGEDASTNDILIDDISIVDVTPTAVPEADVEVGEVFDPITFEDGTAAGFVPRGGQEILTVTDKVNATNNGQYALKVEGRNQNWNGPTLDVSKNITLGHEYKISARVKLADVDSAQLQLSTQIGSGDSASYNNIQSATVEASDDWVLLEGTYRYTSVGDDNVTIYIESTNHASASFYIDDIYFEDTGSSDIKIQEELMPIKDIYQDQFLIGNAVSSKEFTGKRLELLTKHFNVATAENAMKPAYAYGSYPDFDFTAEDALVNAVKEADLDLVGHVLVWHQQSEERLHTDENGVLLDRETALANLRKHITSVVNHFSDDVISWDVVNEAMSDNPANPSDWRSSLRQSAWYQTIGPDFVKESFLAARKALDASGLDVKLYYNDYNDDNQNKAEAIYQMVKEINESYAAENNGRLLIDGIGMQAHYNTHTSPDNVEASLKKFISVTNEVSVTELDITAGSDGELTEEEAAEQAYLYAQLMSIYKKYHEHIARVTFWGLDDGTSWRSASNPLLFDSDLQAKAAYYAIIDPEKYMEEYEPEVKIARQGYAAYGTPDLNNVNDSVWDITADLSLDKYQMAWQGASGLANVLWDENNLYVRVSVSDSQLDDTSENPWEQDSVEVFLDQNNQKTASYQSDDGQYRVNYKNVVTGTEVDGFESKVSQSDSSYVVIMKIPLLSITPAEGTQLGFDVQINDGQDGARQSVAIWNDLSGVGYMDTSVFGNLELVLSYDPSAGISRANLIDLLVMRFASEAASSEHPFKDVTESNPHKNSIGIAYGLGWVKGQQVDRFNPDAAITRAEFATVLARILASQGIEMTVDPSTSTYDDASSIPDYALQPAMLLKSKGYMLGYEDHTFRPGETMSKDAVEAIISEF